MAINVGGIVLCGGRSSRMGAPKAWLPVGAELMLPRVVRVVGAAVGPVVVVAAPGQDVPPLPSGVRVVRDEVEGRGPLGGLAAGLAALEGAADAAYLSSCDVPLLKPEFVRRVVELLEEPNPPAPFPKREAGERTTNLRNDRNGGQGQTRGRTDLGGSSSPAPSPSLLGKGAGGLGPSDATLVAVPLTADRLHPLAAAYRVGVLPVVRAMLAANRLRMTDLFDAIPTRVIEASELADVDPRLDSLRNVNTLDEYEAALRELDPPRPG